MLTFSATLMIAMVVGLALRDRNIAGFPTQLGAAALVTSTIENGRWLLRRVAKDIIRHRSGENS
jgi:hypothetical protein